MGLLQPPPPPLPPKQHAYTLTRIAICTQNQRHVNFPNAHRVICMCLCVILSHSFVDSMPFVCLCVCCDIGFFTLPLVRNARNHTKPIRTGESVENKTLHTIDCMQRPSVFISSSRNSSHQHQPKSTKRNQEHRYRVCRARSLSFVSLFRCAFLVQNQSPSQWKFRRNESDGNQENVVAVVDRETLEHKFSNNSKQKNREKK